MEKSDIKQLISKLGGPSAVGRALGLSHSAVCQWDEIPSDYLVKLENYSVDRGLVVTRQEMRPDLYLPNPNIAVNT